jgi:hypothetical protein
MKAKKSKTRDKSIGKFEIRIPMFVFLAQIKSAPVGKQLVEEKMGQPKRRRKLEATDDRREWRGTKDNDQPWAYSKGLPWNP